MTDLCSGGIFRASSGDGAGTDLWRTDTDAWLEVDLRSVAVRLLHLLTITWWGGCIPSSIVVEVSIDGVSWKPIRSFAGLGVDSESRLTLGCEVTLRFFRLSMQAGKLDPFFHRFRLGVKSLSLTGSVVREIVEEKKFPGPSPIPSPQQSKKLWRPLHKLSGIYAPRNIFIPRLGWPSYPPEYMQTANADDPPFKPTRVVIPIPPAPLPFAPKPLVGDPTEWRKVVDGKIWFYVNAKTGQCCADPPDILFSANDANLPRGWHRQFDHKSGRFFYWHRADSPTWEFPLITFPQS